MCNCIHNNCQYIDFFNDKEFIKNKQLYYVKDVKITPDEYCIFHAPEELKSNFTYNQNELFRKIISEYIHFCKKENRTVDFSYSIFHVYFDAKNIDLKEKNLNLNFTKTIFLEYFRMDNLKCNELIFKDTEFHDGGAIKNRGGQNEVYINKLIFRPYQLESDFVIDIGKYANSDGVIEPDKYGVIKNIRFENHKIGSGVVYFIGLNEQLKEANFRNMILDSVSFQNSDLRQCYFLNAKVDKTEFRNCEFDKKGDFLILAFLAMGFFMLLSTPLVFFEDSFTQLGKAILTLLLIFFIIFFITIGSNKHIALKDEEIRHKDKKIRQNTWKSLSESYRMLKENFSRNNYQYAGDFFYSQRLAQLQYVEKKLDSVLYILHYLINGFGEKFLKPLLTFCLLILFFSGFYIQNKDFIATEQTPQFFIFDTKEVNQSLPYYKNQIFIVSEDDNSSIMKRKFIPQELDNAWTTRFTYSASQFISPFTAKNRVWFKTVSPNAAILNIIETILLYIFFGAFLLAIKNRIKR